MAIGTGDVNARIIDTDAIETDATLNTASRMAGVRLASARFWIAVLFGMARDIGAGILFALSEDTVLIWIAEDTGTTHATRATYAELMFGAGYIGAGIENAISFAAAFICGTGIGK